MFRREVPAVPGHGAEAAATRFGLIGLSGGQIAANFTTGRKNTGFRVICVEVCETFTSIQGESTYAGMPCFFIRLAGCNLSCSYCDTPQALKPGTRKAVGDLVALAADSKVPLVEITGGEPLLQDGFVELAGRLVAETGKIVLVETNGTRDISAIPDKAVAIMDIKCPGSGAGAATDWDNIDRLRPYDEVKFVISDRADFDWAQGTVERYGLHSRCRAVFLSPAAGRLKAADLASWMLAAPAPVRLGLQLHGILGLK